MNIGERISNLRKRQNLTQENLSEIIGVTRQTISNWELGISYPNYKQLELLGKALNVNINDLSTKNNVLYLSYYKK